MKHEEVGLAERRRQVFALRARGQTVKTISKLMGISQATVRTYIEDHKEEIQGTVAQIKRDDYAGITMERFNQLRREAWSNYDKSDKLSEKGRFMKILMDLNKNELSALLDLGCLDRQTVHYEHTLAGVEKVDMAQLDALAAIMTAETLGVTPEQALKMGGRRQPSPRSLDYITNRGPTDEVVGSSFIPVTHARDDEDR